MDAWIILCIHCCWYSESRGCRWFA